MIKSYIFSIIFTCKQLLELRGKHAVDDVSDERDLRPVVVLQHVVGAARRLVCDVLQATHRAVATVVNDA